MVLALVLGLSIYATIRIWRDDFLEPRQRITQTIIVWILPIIGAVVALWRLHEEKLEVKRIESPGSDSDIY